MKIAASFFNKKVSKKWTWKSPDGVTENEIDHLMINNMKIVKNIEILNNFSFSSDHRIGRCQLKIPKSKNSNKIYNKHQILKIIIPTHKYQEANKILESKLISKNFNEIEEAKNV